MLVYTTAAAEYIICRRGYYQYIAYGIRETIHNRVDAAQYYIMGSDLLQLNKTFFFFLNENVQHKQLCCCWGAGGVVTENASRHGEQDDDIQIYLIRVSLSIYNRNRVQRFMLFTASPTDLFTSKKRREFSISPNKVQTRYETRRDIRGGTAANV